MHHEALAVIIGDAGEEQALADFARKSPCRVVRQNIDFARLQRGETVLGGENDEFHLRRIIEDRRRNGAAEIDVEASPVACVIGQAESRETRI